jgi:hypothetical protein
MRERNLIETARRVGLPIVLAIGLTGTAAACGEDKGTTQEELQKIFETTSEQCAEHAQSIYDEQFPAVEISDDPTTEELSTALASMEASETDGEAVKKDAYDNCMEINFYGFEPVVSTTTVPEVVPTSEAPVTTEDN